MKTLLYLTKFDNIVDNKIINSPQYSYEIHYFYK